MSKKELPVRQAPACRTPMVREPLSEGDAKALAGLIDCERRGTWVYYWVPPDTLGSLGALLSIDARAGTGAP